MTAVPKLEIVRDRDWLDELRTRRCLITGQRGHDGESVVGAHIGTTGKGWSKKCSDDECIPLLNRFHLRGHDTGEITNLRKLLPDEVLTSAFNLLEGAYGGDWTRETAPNDVLREALRLYAKELYKSWKSVKD